MKPNFTIVIERLNLLGILAKFQPTLIGTPPLLIDIDESDIDIACTASDLEIFRGFTEQSFGHHDNFLIKDKTVHNMPSVVVSFKHSNWEVELFCQKIPIKNQWGVRHFLIEQRLLELAPHLRSEIRRLKKLGFKTEPAFAKVLALSGEPHQAVLALENKSDSDLRSILKRYSTN